MKALSLINPWAGLVVIGVKQVETRSFSVKYRGPVFIHASKTQVTENDISDEFNYHYSRLRDVDFDICGIRGAIIGAACLYDIVPVKEIVVYSKFADPDAPLPIHDQRNESGHAIILPDAIAVCKRERAFGNYDAGRFGWLMRDPVLFSKPIPMRGALGLWNVTPEHLTNLGTKEAQEAFSYWLMWKDKYISLK